jgi:hypothetical protein
MDSTALYDKLEKATDEFVMYLGGYIMGVDPKQLRDTVHDRRGRQLLPHVRSGAGRAVPQGLRGRPTMLRAPRIYQQAQQKLADDAVFFPSSPTAVSWP